MLALEMFSVTARDANCFFKKNIKFQIINGGTAYHGNIGKFSKLGSARAWSRDNRP